MTQARPSFLQKLPPYIGLGIFIILAIIGVIVFSYILIIGAIIGLVLFVIAYIRARFFSKHHTHPENTKHTRGRIIDQDKHH